MQLKTILLFVVLLLTPAALYAGEDTTNLSEYILEITLSVVAVILTTFLVPWLNNAKNKKKEEYKDQHLSFVDRLKRSALIFSMQRAVNVIEKDYPLLVEGISNRDSKENLTSVVKNSLYAFGAETKQSLIQHFKQEGFDLVSELGEECVEDIIRYAVDRVSPFPPGSTTSDMIVSLASKGADQGKAQLMKILREKGN